MIPAALAARAAAQPSGPTSPAHLVELLTSMVNVLGRGTTRTASDVTRRALGLAHVVTDCNVAGSVSDVLIDPATNGALRVGYDLPVDVRRPTLGRSQSWARRTIGWAR